MSHLPRPPAVPDLPWQYEADKPGDYLVIVDVEAATRTVVWQDNEPVAQLTRYRRPGRLPWFTWVTVVQPGTLIQLETDGADPVFTVVHESDAETVDTPGIGAGVCRDR